MALYIIVHHRRDNRQPWANDWSDDQKLRAITTTVEVARLCKEAKRKSDRLYIHRCAWGECVHTICCSICVKRVESIDNNTSLIEFTDLEEMDFQPPLQPSQGQNYYIV